MANRRAHGQGRERATEVVDRATRRAEARKRGRAGAVPDGNKGWTLPPPVWTWLAWGVMIVLFARYYYWAIHPDTSQPLRDVGEYTLLTDAFLHGQASLRLQPAPQLLALKDPYDPAANAPYRLHDASLYKGHYYIYFGAAPVVVLYFPYWLVTGEFLPDRSGAWVFAVAAYGMGCLLLKLLLNRLWPRAPAWLLYFLCASLGFSNTFPFLLRRPSMYEIAISAGQFFVFLALYTIARSALDKKFPRLMAALGGLALAGALASRPPMALAAVALIWFLFLGRDVPWGERIRRLAMAAIPFAAGLFLQLWYNYVRFDSPFEFGNHYQLAGINIRTLQYFSVSRLSKNLWFNVLEPVRLCSHFPFIVLAPNPPFQIPKNFVGPELVAGIVWVAPLVLFLVAAPLIWKRIGGEARMEWAVCTGTLVSLGVAWNTVDGMLASTMRYEADFAGVLLVAAGLVIAGLSQSTSTGGRAWIHRGVVVLGLLGIMVNSAIGVTGYYDNLRRAAPAQYQALSNWFSPVERVLASLGVPPERNPAPGVSVN